MDKESKQKLEEMITDAKARLSKYQGLAEKDLEIDETEIDRAVLDTPKIHSRWNNYFGNETLYLNSVIQLREAVKLERWKYYMGKQTDQYYARNGIVHEKILKTDVDRYMNADPKMALVVELHTAQKMVVEYIERTIKEIQSRNFHCRVAVDWRKFVSGVN